LCRDHPTDLTFSAPFHGLVGAIGQCYVFFLALSILGGGRVDSWIMVCKRTLPPPASFHTYDRKLFWPILTGMTNKTRLWSHQNVSDFLRENDFDFMEGLDGSKGTWVKLKRNGEPGIMFDVKFTAGNYGKRQIAQIMRLSKIPEKKWTEWFEARLGETAP
jgi:hypothetical protein